ncbi:hypothetical protein QBC34DRAFT_380266 [Podospora aff. communis PSN243]|uniref:PH domain-containing protein n=1 Tax=Podospora aff. communis PSN243 TaxID=3040156 RepID=A0AAV9GLP6_9PEZI|nr:hypothetical protein QBC34DRAFT_380266 [Podospora aff. communis PSN243]
MDIDKETIPELQPIFAFLNSHTNKLYQEGYFLKLDDQDIKGNPNPDRTWTECFAQLVGTVLSLWDAAELDAAGDDGEVLPKFINLTDASIKMIESLPTRSNDEQPLQNILSISTAGRNRYLLHFNSHHSLIQWTSGIRLAMFEHSTLQEAYTGALIAGKGKLLNNINIIMERARVPVQEWVRVRFGAGVPWRRCWCVIDPPNEKEYQKAQKDLKKRSPYDRSHAPIMKGEIRFYDSKKEAEKKKKHAHPIATITDAYSAYSIYPQSKALIEGSTLLKVEGQITIHSDPPSATEGFVFIMPEVPPAVSGFEMLLRFLFPTWDVFGLYGRPGRLVASTLDPRSLMFGMPKHRRYGYLEILDVSGLILTEGSAGWSERDWRKKLKDVTSQRMTAVEEGGSSTHSRSASRSSKRLSFGPQNPAPPRARVGFADDSAVRTGRPLSVTQPGLRTDSAPPDHNRERASPPATGQLRHARNVSDTQLGDIPPSLSMDGQGSMQSAMRNQQNAKGFSSDLASTPERLSSEDESMSRGRQEPLGVMRRMETPEPVNAPPAFSHNASSRPQQQPYHSPDLRKATSRLSNATLTQLATAGGVSPEAFRDSSERQGESRTGSTPGQADPRGPAVQPQASANPVGMNANVNGSREALMSPNSSSSRSSPRLPPPNMGLSQKRSKSPLGGTNPHGGGPHDGGQLPFRPGPHMGAPQHQGGRGAPPMMNPRGPPPQGRGMPPGSRDLRMGPPGQGPQGPPPGRRTPPPGIQRPPQTQGGSPPINRKPLPPRTNSLQRQDGGDVPVRGPQSPGHDGNMPPPVPVHHPRRQNSERSAVSSRHDDASSTASPDYASTRRSTDTQESVDRADRPRAGVLKMIGNDPVGSEPGSGADSQEYTVPDVNFGPTINYGASKNVPTNARPIEPGHMVPAQQSYGRKSPGPGPSYTHYRQESDDTIRRSVAWQPGIAAVGSGDAALSPEQFVQQRAAAAATPLYAHQRNPSANTLTEYGPGSPVSPNKRPGSHNASHSRHNSADLLQNGRPLSQGTAAALSGGELSSYLSAREQEHVARVTGSPLIAFSGNKPAPQPQSGLVGAINARERERAQMKAGIGGHAVAQAIDQRTREQNQQAQRAAQAAYAQQQAQLAAQQGYQSPGVMGTSSPNMYGQQMGGMMAGGMGHPRHGSGPQQAPGYGAQQHRPQMPSQGSFNGGGQYGQSGGWNQQLSPNQQHRPPMLQNQPGYGPGAQGGQPQSPGFQVPPQGQYTPPGGTRPGTPGRMPFQGQAF